MNLALTLAILPVLAFSLAFSPVAGAVVPLIAQEEPAKDWTFNNGQEFGGGAKGGLGLDAAAAREGKPTLKLEGDFSKAGMYVQAGKKFLGTEIKGISMWVKNPGGDRFTMRLIDGSGQCHQIALVTDTTDNWQKIEFPIAEFFAKRGQSDAIPGVAKYESWGGAKDSKWHQPVTAVYLLLGKTDAQPKRTLWLNDVTLVPEPPKALVETSVNLSEGGVSGWIFTNGPEFKGATGTLIDQDGGAMKLTGDFTGGGAYVAAVKRLLDVGMEETTSFQVSYQSSITPAIRIQLVDGTGQTHQRKLKINPDGKWNSLEILPSAIAGGEHWGGKNDGKWHPPARLISIALNNGADKRAEISLKDISVKGNRSATIAEAFRADFKGEPWTTEGGVSVDGDNLKFSRTENEANQPAVARSPSFKVTNGNWRIALSAESGLVSPDSSYSGTVVLEVADASGKVIDKLTVADLYGPKPWTDISRTVELPEGAATARFVAQLNKTWGTFRIARISAGFLSPSDDQPNAVTRILFSTAALGNLLLPEDPRSVSLTVHASKSLPQGHKLTCVVRDYWGVEQTAPVDLELTAGGKGIYTATLDLAKVPLEIGRYYEVEATSQQQGAKPFSHQTSFAILPESPNRKVRPEEIPFTARNWDNRIPEYIRLSDRFGIRIVGLWGGWSSKPPYKPELPQIELVKKLGLGWLTTTPAKFIEDGKRDYDETALRQGMKNFINEFGGHRPMIINLGNEPHGTGERVKANVEAYRVLYDEVKKVDPSIPVVATSVEPNPEYFNLGYGKYCDAFDFHVYETPEGVRANMRKYKDLMKEHDVVKPLWSTELGLNSQGQTRHVVAVEVFKKTAAFFAEGGANMCWFGFLYPDPEGKSHGSSGDSHNLFDCRFNRYAPRLDAIAWYHAVNAVGKKKFVAEKTYAEGVRAFLFRDQDGKSLQFLWKENGVADLNIPLAGAGEVELIRVDGSVSTLDAGGKTLTLSIGEDPILLTYEGQGDLAEELEKTSASFSSLPAVISATGETRLPASASGGMSLRPVTPSLWKISGDLTLTPPPGTKARELPVVIRLEEGGRVCGELYRRLPVK